MNTKPKTHILHLLQYGKLGGGVNKTLVTQLQAMDRSKFQVYAVAAEAGPIVDELRPFVDEITVIPVPLSVLYQNREAVRPGLHNLVDFAQLVPFFIACCRFILSRKIDVIHCHNLKTNFFGIIVAQICRITVICHIRSATPLGAMGRIYELGATKIVSVSKGARDASFERIRRPKKHAVIYNGRDLEEFQPDSESAKLALRSQLGLGDSQLVVAIVGGLIRWKGHSDFIKAARLVVDIYPQTQFLIVGDADYESPDYVNELKNLITELGISANIIFTGFRKDINRIYNTIDILVSASWYEALGGVMLEGMACAKPVIGTNAGGTPEIVEDGVTGIIVPPKEHQILASAMLDLLGNKAKRETMGRQGRLRVERLFSVARYVNDIQALYLQLAE